MEIRRDVIYNQIENADTCNDGMGGCVRLRHARAQGSRGAFGVDEVRGHPSFGSEAGSGSRAGREGKEGIRHCPRGISEAE